MLLADVVKQAGRPVHNKEADLVVGQQGQVAAGKKEDWRPALRVDEQSYTVY